MAGGGTGGHIYPAVAIAEHIKSKHPSAEILFIGTERGLEKKLVPQSGYPIRFITVTGFNRKELLKNFKTLLNLRQGLKEAKEIISEFKPDIVIGTGGYVCGPVVKVAAEMGIRAFIHEQNAFPGLTNHLLEKHAEKVFTGFEEAGARFKNQGKIVFSGNPVRKEFYNAGKKAARAKLGVPDSSFMVLSFGGSQGADKINEAMAEAAAVFSDIDGIVLFFATGSRHYSGIVSGFEERGIRLGENIRILPYLDEMDQYLAACDIVISRAGALTVSEIAVSGKPAILVPSPNVTGNHQYFNAKAASERGGAILMEEKGFSAEGLISILLKMKNNRGILEEMEKACTHASQVRAVEVIYSNLGIDGS